MKFRIYIIGSLLLLRLSLLAGDAPPLHDINKSDWDKAVHGLNYNEKPDEPMDIDPDTQVPSFHIDPLWGRIIGFTLVGALLIFVIYKLFGKDLFARNKKVAAAKITTLEEMEDRPMESDLEKFLREALAARNYKLAIRIYYLIILKTLHEKGLIVWKKNKTNMDYLSEMSAHPEFPQLMNNTHIFEFVWYGDQPLQEDQFNSISASFTGVIDKISREK